MYFYYIHAILASVYMTGTDDIIDHRYFQRYCCYIKTMCRTNISYLYRYVVTASAANEDSADRLHQDINQIENGLYMVGYLIENAEGIALAPKLPFLHYPITGWTPWTYSSRCLWRTAKASVQGHLRTFAGYSSTPIHVRCLQQRDMGWVQDSFPWEALSHARLYYA